MSVNDIAGQDLMDTSSILWRKGYLDIHHINTGRGVSTFMVMPDGTKMVLDLGDMNDIRGEKSLPLTVTPPYPNNSKNSGEWVSDYINQVVPSGKRQIIDYAILTHFHSDHYGLVRDGLFKSMKGDYYLSGLTQLGEDCKINNWIDRNYPYYNYPTDLRKVYKEDGGGFENLLKFITYQKIPMD